MAPVTRFRLGLLACSLAVLVLVDPAVAVNSSRSAAAVAVDVAAGPGAGIPHTLQGYAYDARVAGLAYQPPSAASYRLDAGLDRLYDCQSGQLQPAGLQALNDALDVMVAQNAEPIVILDYMPACLADTAPGDVRDPRLLPPRSAASWHQVVTELVTALGPGRRAAGKRPVRYFEAWNEPDGLFWQGTMAQYVTDVEMPSGHAVAEVASASGLPLRYSVAATTFPDPAWQLPLLQAAVQAGIPVGFVSWHYYGNYPTLGPDGGEPGESPVLATLAGHANPAADPLSLGAGVHLMRQLVEPVLHRVPELVLDEWNLSAGGFDLRHDTYIGAAFQAASLIELADAELDRALLYASVDVHSTDQAGRPLPVRHGDWGIVDRDGIRKPAWYAQQLFGRLGGRRLPVDAHPQPDFWLAATRDPSYVHVLAAAFTAHPEPTAGHRLSVRLTHLTPGPHTVWSTRIDAEHLGDRAEPAAVVVADAHGEGVLDIALPDNGVCALDVSAHR